MDDRHRTLAGRYQLHEVIGRGGMGTVYRATDVVLGRAVAVKVLPGQLVDQEPASVERFQREARAAAALSHPGVVAVYDAGVDDLTRFIVMELVPGRSLDAIIREQAPLNPERAAGIAAGVADALAAAHAARIIHRDIKPGNVMIAGDGAVKVLDFGIARALDSTSLTAHASVLGTAAYISPEQALGHDVDPRSDIYSLGCVLYAMLTGEPPFRGDSAAAVLHQQAHAAPPALRGTGDPGLEALVGRMLAKAPEQRPPSAAAVRDQLLGLTGRPAPPGETAATRRLTPLAQPSRRWKLAAAAAVAVLVGILIALLTAGGGAPRGGTSTPHQSSSTAPATTTVIATKTVVVTTTAPAAPPPGPPAGGPAPPAVGAAAGAVTALVTQDVRAGSIDQQAAQQLNNSLADILRADQQGHTMDIQHKLADLSKHLAMLQQHGDITAAAAPGIARAIAGLAAALR